MTPVSIGIDVGGTKITGALIEPDGASVHESTIPSPRSAAGVDPGASATASLVQRLLDSARADGRSVVAIGIGVPEYVTPDGRIASAEVLAWRPEDLETIRAAGKVWIESDVRCAALAERQVGDGSRFDSFLFVSIGTGVSHTLCIDGRLVIGHRGEAIALGEFPVGAAAALRPEAPLTVEQQASGRAIELHLAECRLSDRGLPSNEEVSSHAGRLMAEAITSAVGLVDPEAVILGGGLGSSSGHYADSLIAEAGSRLARRPDPPPIIRSRLGNRGGVLGAGLLAHEGCR